MTYIFIVWRVILALNSEFGAEFGVWRWILSLAVKFGAEFGVWRWIKVWRWIRSLALNIRKCETTFIQQAIGTIVHKSYEKWNIPVHWTSQDWDVHISSLSTLWYWSPMEKGLQPPRTQLCKLLFDFCQLLSNLPNWQCNIFHFLATYKSYFPTFCNLRPTYTSYFAELLGLPWSHVLAYRR